MSLGIFGNLLLGSVRSTCRSGSFNLVRNGAPTIQRFFANMSGNLKIGTHDGCFQCDEALAVFLLKCLPKYKDATLVRTRNYAILDTCDIVVDVGGIYDHSKLRYDHHMREFKESLSTVMKKPGYDCDIKLSSAGLIYCHYGHEIIRNVLSTEISDEDVEKIFKKVYDNLIKEVDAIDNGVPMFPEEPRYRIVTDLSSRVERLNPCWNEKTENTDELFLKAVELTGEEFTYFVRNTAMVWLPAKSIVQSSIERRFEVDPSGEIVELNEFVPWKYHLRDIEIEMNITTPIKYVIFKSSSIRICGVPVEPKSFVLRMPLPEPWAGLRFAELQAVCGIESAEFVHKERFIGGSLTRDGALAMARKALELGKLNQ